MKTITIGRNDVIYSEVDIGNLPKTKAETHMKTYKDMLKQTFPSNQIMVVPTKGVGKSMEITIIKRGT